MFRFCSYRLLPLLIIGVTLPACVGLGISGKVEKPVYHRFEAKEGAELIVDAPGGFRVNAKGPVIIETSGEALYEVSEEE